MQLFAVPRSGDRARGGGVTVADHEIDPVAEALCNCGWRRVATQLRAELDTLRGHRDELKAALASKAARAVESDETVAVGPVYLAGPITATPARSVAENIASAAATLRYLTDRRVAAVCPQLTAAVPMLDAVDYEDWMAVDFVLLRSCRAVLALPGWDQSGGTVREIAHAEAHGVPVFFAVRQLFDYLGVSARAARPLGATPKG